MRHSLKPPVILLHPAHRSVSSNGYLLGFTSFATFQLLCIFQPICFPVVRWHLNWLLNKRDMTLWDRHSLPSELQFLILSDFYRVSGASPTDRPRLFENGSLFIGLTPFHTNELHWRHSHAFLSFFYDTIFVVSPLTSLFWKASAFFFFSPLFLILL